MKKALLEAFKEFLRTLILGMIPILGAIILFVKSGINVELGTFDIKWVVALAMLISGFLGVFQTALMSALDKWIHESGVETPLDFKSLGK